MNLNIGLDLYGGDFAPACNVGGLQLALERQPQLIVTIFGDENEARNLLSDFPDLNRIRLVHAPNKIEMGDSPMRSLTNKPQSSISTGLRYLKDGLIHGFASAGNTGAIFGASVILLGPVLPNIRPCLMTEVPRLYGRDAIILDVGANADTKPETLVDFALLGGAYCKYVLHIDNPRVGLINIGEEPEKGNELTKSAFKILSQEQKINFTGNMEPDKLFVDAADVYVCNGFVGNIILKLSESLINLVRKLGFAHPYFERFNYENLGGSPILGVNGSVVIGHGVSNENAIANMILKCKDLAASGLQHKIKTAFGL